MFEEFLVVCFSFGVYTSLRVLFFMRKLLVNACLVDVLTCCAEFVGYVGYGEAFAD